MILSIEIKQRLSSLVSLGPDSFLFPLLSEGLTLFSTVPPFCNRTVAFFVLRDRVLSYASPSFAFPAALVPLSCLLLPLLVKPLRCCFLALLCSPPLLVLVVVMLWLFSVCFPQAIRLARCRHRVLGGARMVDVSATRSESELPNSGKFVLPSPRD